MPGPRAMVSAGGKRKKATRKGRQTLSKRISKLEKEIATSEVKYFDFSTFHTSQDITTFGSVYWLNDVIAAVGGDQRIGDQVQMTKVSLNMSIALGDTGTHNHVRLILAKDRRPNGLIPALSNILAPVGSLPTVNSLLQMESGDRGRWHVFLDEEFVVDPASPVHLVRKTVDLNFRYNNPDAGGGITNASEGTFYLFTVSDSGATPHPVINGSIRLRYTDL